MYMKRLIFTLLLLPSLAWGSASIVPAWNNYSCAAGKTCTGPAINAAKQGTNNAYWGGTNGVSIGFDKTGSKDTITVSGPPSIAVDCTLTDSSYDIASFNKLTLCKSDATAHTLTPIDSLSRAILLGPLTIQGECWELTLIGSVWYAK